MPTYTFAFCHILSRTAGERMYPDYSIIFSHGFLQTGSLVKADLAFTAPCLRTWQRAQKTVVAVCE